MFIKTFKKSFKSFLTHACTPPWGLSKNFFAIPVGEYGCGQNKSSNRPVKKFFFYWPVCRSGYNSGYCVRGFRIILLITSKNLIGALFDKKIFIFVYQQ